MIVYASPPYWQDRSRVWTLSWGDPALPKYKHTHSRSGILSRITNMAHTGTPQACNHSESSPPPRATSAQSALRPLPQAKTYPASGTVIRALTLGSTQASVTCAHHLSANLKEYPMYRASWTCVLISLQPANKSHQNPESTQGTFLYKAERESHFT